MATAVERQPQQLAVNEEETRSERLRAYRQKVEQKLRNRLEQLVCLIEKDFRNVQLDMGPRQHYPLPWQSPNWLAVEKRVMSVQRRGGKRKPPPSEETRDVEPLKKPKLEVAEVVGKKGRGRPRQSLPTEPTKRSPGRPRKQPITAGPVKLT